MLIVHDANIFIDMEAGGLLDAVFRLEHDVITPNALYDRELKEQHSHLIELGLVLYQVEPEGVERSWQLAATYNATSAMDRLCIALAEQEGCPLLTGDKRLKAAAKKEGCDVRGTLWLVEELVRENIVSIDQAHAAYYRMETAGRRLPFATAHRRLHKLA